MRLLFSILLIAFCHFHLAADKAKMVVLLGEDEYSTKQTLPRFIDQTCLDSFEVDYVLGDSENRHQFKGIEKIAEADLLVLSVWRLALPKGDLKLIRDHIKAGKPVFVLRTSTHGFALRDNQEVPVGSDQWPDFDQEVLGCDYNGHYSSGLMTEMSVDKNNPSPIVSKFRSASLRSWLYKVQPMSQDVKVLLWGQVGESEKEPLAWTRETEHRGKVFCTTLGHPEDFFNKNVQELIYRGLHWCMGKDVSKDQFEYKFFADYKEEKVPFISTSFDGSDSKNSKLKNVSSRTTWLRVGEDYNIAFDQDLLRVAMIWKGEGVSVTSMAYGSYHLDTRSKKSKQGESNLPKPIGEPMLSMPMVAGVESGTSTWTDPRAKLADKAQLSHGPLPQKKGHFDGIYNTESGPVLSYVLNGVKVLDKFEAQRHGEYQGVRRSLQISEHKENLVFHLGQFKGELVDFKKQSLTIKMKSGKYLHLACHKQAEFQKHERGLDLIVEKSQGSLLYVDYYLTEGKISLKPEVFELAIDLKPVKRWGEEVIVKTARTSVEGAAFIQEEIPLPFMNKERRHIRSADLSFFSDGRMAIVTFDGDVWVAKQLDSRRYSWRRYAAGLHEPQGIVVREDEVFVFDRNGLQKLIDRDNNGESDKIENFCSLMVQSSETREFAMSLELHPDGGFVIAKGGQRGETLNPHAGAVLKVSADGKHVEKIAGGLREPYIGVDSKTGDVFASDQQGHWVPTTPFHHIKKGAHYGFLAHKLNETTSNVEPATLNIPHPVLQSGVGILRLHSKEMKQFRGKLLYADYSKPAVALIDYDPKQPKQAAIFRVHDQFNFPILKVAQNPKNGFVYLTGFQIWDSKAKRISGLTRLRPSKTYQSPLSSKSYQEGIQLDFAQPIQANSLIPKAFTLERWNYLRASKYGSGYYKLNGNAGKEQVLFSSLTLSEDKKSLFIAIPDMKESMQLSLTYSAMTEKGEMIEGEAYMTPRSLEKLDLKKAGFPEIDFNALALKFESDQPKMASVQFGKSVIERVGCMGCHSVTDQREGRNGPPWKGLFHSKRKLKTGELVSANEDYLKESILNPLAKVSEGYEALMPPYAGLLNEVELDSIILYLKSIK